MLKDTLNVKLRYERIIKNLLENEQCGQQSNILKVIHEARAETKVIMVLGK